MSRICAFSVAMLLVRASGVLAQPLEDAEQALTEIDFDKTVELAQRAIEAGHLTPTQLARAYELMGQAEAARSDAHAARGHYIRQLALDPDADVNRNLAPRLRSPFLEARGYWASRSSRLGVQVRLARASRGLRIMLTDPLGMANQVRVLTRIAGTYVEMTEYLISARPSSLVPVQGLPEADQIEYVVEVLDAHSNHIIEVGSTDEPAVVGSIRTATGSPAPALPGDGQPDNEEPDDTDSEGGGYGWLWAVAAVVVVGSAVGLGYAVATRPIGLEGNVSFR